MITLKEYIKTNLNNYNNFNNDFIYLDDLLESVTQDILEGKNDSWYTKGDYYVKQNGDVLLFPNRILYDKQISLNQKSSDKSSSTKYKHLYNYMLWAGNHAMERHNERKVTIKEITDTVKEAYPQICDLYKAGKLEPHDATKTAVIIKYQGDNKPPISIVVFIEKASYYNKETKKYINWPTLYNRTPDIKIKTVAKYWDFASIFRNDGKIINNKTGVTSYEYHIFLDENGKPDKWQMAKETALHMRDVQKNGY